MNNRCRLGSLGKSPTAFFSCPLYFPFAVFRPSILPMFIRFISILLFPCSNVLENTRVCVPRVLQPYRMKRAVSTNSC